MLAMVGTIKFYEVTQNHIKIHSRIEFKENMFKDFKNTFWINLSFVNFYMDLFKQTDAVHWRDFYCEIDYIRYVFKEINETYKLELPTPRFYLYNYLYI